MSHFGDYMDGVPVKISEKYKRPPRIELPYSVNECAQRAQNVIDSIKYCTTFEGNVLSKLKELRSAKETKKNERRHRLQLLEEAKQKKLDAIAAAEAEEKLKQLSVSEVSYPSTDEISALSLDEKLEKNCDIPLVEENALEVDRSISTEPYVNNIQESQQNILQPVQVQTSYQKSLLDDPDPLQELKMSAKLGKIPQYNHNVDTLTFRDFENDTSSPFDYVELKTINDMELLAQVLQRDSGSNEVQGIYVPDQTYTGYTNCATQAQIEGGTYLPNSYMEQTIQDPSATFSSPQNFPVPNGYYLPPENTIDNMTLENVNMYMPNYQFYTPTQSMPPDLYYNNPMPTTSEITQINNDSSFIPQPYYFQYPQVPMQYINENKSYNTNEVTEKPIEGQTTVNISQSTIKSRSRSVPDIVRELNEELASAKLRASERSCNASPAPTVVVPRPSSSSEKKERRRRKHLKLPNPYEQFPIAKKRVCERIHVMGFPLDRVARVCLLVGDNDKRIIECLLIVGELLDLGFPEIRVFSACSKHKFDKDKALDELVSSS